ncbi:MAG TPA: hypothetical protein DCL44_04965 [Elusimicrobia bacterium]|nr:hypothetical protein [Elusimicrobiota bacterium]
MKKTLAFLLKSQLVQCFFRKDRSAWFIALAVVACACASAPLRYGGADSYKNFAELSAANTEGRDYSCEVYDRGSKITVFAVHGGDIELTTSRVARKLAGAEFNLYIFNGWLQKESRKLHMTSTHFDDPRAIGLSTGAVLGVSVHAQLEPGRWVCVGGLNKAAAEMTASGLRAAGFSAETPCALNPGVSPQNISNRASAGGVQLEISLQLLKGLESSPPDLTKFTEAVRNSVLDYLNTMQGEKK